MIVLGQRSLSALSSTDLERLKVYFKNMRKEYKENSIVKFRVVGRELYPSSSFDATPTELTAKYLPRSSTEYEIKDADTEEVTYHMVVVQESVVIQTETFSEFK